MKEQKTNYEQKSRHCGRSEAIQKYIFFVFVLFFGTIIISCNSIVKDVSEGKSRLELEIDSLRQINENLTTSFSFLFEKALDLENLDKDSAISIYRTIAESKNGDFWSIESEKRILNLTKEENKKKSIRDLELNWLWFGDTLELTQKDDKCGEWGGDIATIKIYKKPKSFRTFGYYTKKSFNCDSLEMYPIYRNLPSTIYKSKEIEFTHQQMELLKEAILDLADYKINNSNAFGHSGIINTILIKEKDKNFSGSFHISDYPSFHWNNFHKLKNEILKQAGE